MRFVRGASSLFIFPAVFTALIFFHFIYPHHVVILPWSSPVYCEKKSFEFLGHRPQAAGRNQQS
jgi:hypothetical protein